MEVKGIKVIVTGANGPLGREVALWLLESGAYVTGLSRQCAPADFRGAWQVCDLLQEDDVRPSLAGQDVVVHCASNVERPQDDVDALDNLLAASQALGTFRLVYVSICGIDSAAGASPYYAMKLRNEATLEQSGRPHTIVRLSQFFPFLASLLSGLVCGEQTLVPDLVLQPVDLEFAAQRLALMALQQVQGRTPDIHGSEALSLRAMAELWSKSRGISKPIVPAPTEGMMLGFAALSPLDGAGGGPTWAQWLASTPAKLNPYKETLDL